MNFALDVCLMCKLFLFQVMGKLEKTNEKYKSFISRVIVLTVICIFFYSLTEYVHVFYCGGIFVFDVDEM